MIILAWLNTFENPSDVFIIILCAINEIQFKMSEFETLEANSILNRAKSAFQILLL